MGKKAPARKQPLRLPTSEMFEDSLSWNADFVLTNKRNAEANTAIKLAGGRRLRPPHNAYSSVETPAYLERQPDNSLVLVQRPVQQQLQRTAKAQQPRAQPRVITPQPETQSQAKDNRSQYDGANSCTASTTFLTAGPSDWQMSSVEPPLIKINPKNKTSNSFCEEDPSLLGESQTNDDSLPSETQTNDTSSTVHEFLEVPPEPHVYRNIVPKLRGRSPLGEVSQSWFAVPARSSYVLAHKRCPSLHTTSRLYKSLANLRSKNEMLVQSRIEEEDRRESPQRQRWGRKVEEIHRESSQRQQMGRNTSASHRHQLSVPLSHRDILSRVSSEPLLPHRMHELSASLAPNLEVLANPRLTANTRAGGGLGVAMTRTVSGNVIRCRRPDWYRLELGRV